MSNIGGKQVKLGAVFSYILIIANALYGLFITPFILTSLGESTFGVYRTVASLSAALMIVDLGIGGTVMRYVAKYRADGDLKRISPFVSMIMCEAWGIILLLAALMSCIYFNLNNIYSGSFTPAEIELTQQLFIILSLCLALHVFENVLNGIISGYNNFIFANGIKLVRLLIRCVLICVVLSHTSSALALASIDLFVTLGFLALEIAYVKLAYRVKLGVSFKHWDSGVFKESSFYTFLLFLTAIAAQINSNMHNVIIGAFKGPELVTIYSFGLLIFGMFEQLSMAISGVMLPTVTQVLKQDEGNRNIQQLIVNVGRVQFLLLGAAVVGFALLGQQFVQAWLGNGFEDVYIIVMVLMLPTLFELCVNVCLSVLRAKNMLGFRTAVLFASSALNLVITIIGVKYISYIAASAGTAISFILGSLLVMNIYYYKKLGFHMIRIYRGIMSRIWVCLLLAGTAVAISRTVFTEGWSAFLLNVLVFSLVYGLSLLLYGLTKEERTGIPFLNKLIHS